MNIHNVQILNEIRILVRLRKTSTLVFRADLNNFITRAVPQFNVFSLSSKFKI